ncbi:MAG: hypothetical protein IJ642_10110 [Oscillospiraceae bacterium]|nr:hypothetical protein [Oscillospiraceae bacterium]
MKNFKTIAVLTASMALAVNAVPFAASAEDTEYLYGTMEIPYAEFYQAELEATPYEIDAVSSATTTKWSKNGEGELFEGSYHSEAAEDGSGQILGVIYPVAVTQADLDALGEENYHFTALEEAPEAYKTVTVTDGKAEFSVIQDDQPETFDTTITLATSSRYGDYQINPAEFPENTAVYGALVKTSDGNVYAMRHEQNIWRQGALSWSCGLTLTEGHGNALDVENYDQISGKTVSEVVYITKSGYLTINTDTYVPVKFENTLEVENGTAGTGSVTLTKTGYPEDYHFAYEIADNFSVGEDDVIAYADAVPGSYTLTVSDADGKYAPFTASFVLSTEDLPVAFDDDQKKLIPAENFTEEESANFIKNISNVNVNGTDYSASGKGAIQIIASDGVLNLEAASGRGDTATPVFNAENGEYTLTVTATGYDTPLTFSFNASAAETTTTTESSTTKTTTKTSTSASTTTSSGSESPKTGDSKGLAIPAAILAAAGLTAIAAKKKK